MKEFNNTEDIITYLYHKFVSHKNSPLIKDTTRLSKIKFDAYLDSTISNPMSFSIFELSDKGELLIDNPAKIMESEAAFFLFVNPRHNWIFAVENTLENQKKLIRGEELEKYKIKLF
ncbi:hypothetical protein II906_09945 [bacterium]|nr:hypothetical protein [bacterium]